MATASFQPFPRLPFELRALIWGFAAAPRIVHIRTGEADFSSPTPPPAVIQASKEARRHAPYQKSFFTATNTESEPRYLEMAYKWSEERGGLVEDVDDMDEELRFIIENESGVEIGGFISFITQDIPAVTAGSKITSILNHSRQYRADRTATQFAAMAQTIIHRGSFASIPSTATPGLAWLKNYMPVVDSLDGDATRLSSLTTPDARFVFNGKAGVTTPQIAAMLSKRSEKLRAFRHEGAVAWDVAKEDGTRSLLFESTSVTAFKDDDDGVEARVAEFSVVELVRDGDGSWKATELRTFMDPSPASPENRQKAA
ncbi:hypothetical protein G7Z17_g9582 [Cylindrodendrum hubeiense]|uniref:2EXR domain-containing protein n=1 Tax=Cylindrodendrum hubeiense TaxID=595255 RepID=A0A9P5H4A1_9HYPO|nr:hypothetical protein G7Z17_g9582 [Cylindrodendrum hubeiense]